MLTKRHTYDKITTKTVKSSAQNDVRLKKNPIFTSVYRSRPFWFVLRFLFDLKNRVERNENA